MYVCMYIHCAALYCGFLAHIYIRTYLLHMHSVHMYFGSIIRMIKEYHLHLNAYMYTIPFLQGYLISVTANDTVNLWSLRQRPAGVMHQLHLKKEKYTHVLYMNYYCRVFCTLRVTKCSYTYGSQWLYVGTDKSNIHLVRVEGLALSAYTIPWNKVAES